MFIPKQFTINDQVIRVEIVDKLEGSKYGDYNDVKELIRISKTIEIDKEIINLSEDQILNTFFHEVFHAFQFHSKGEYSESEASSYAGMMVELVKSGNLKITSE